jgi:transketolase
MGLYAMWALRNEVARVGAPELLPKKIAWQMRLEDLLGFRKNPITPTKHFLAEKSKALDGHAGPNVPFVPISTGPSGVATAATCGIAFAALDTYPEKTPWIHVIEGETGMTAGRVHEVLGVVATNRLSNVIMHLDWNQASIDSNRPCREGTNAGDYVQWTPAELGFTNDWNVIFVDDGFDFKKVLTAQKAAEELSKNHQPTMIVYRTVKGWRYGIEGKDSHGAGHKCCSEEFYKYLSTFEQAFNVKFPRVDGSHTDDNLEECFWQSLMTVRKVVEQEKEMTTYFAGTLRQAQIRLKALNRQPRESLPKLQTIFDDTQLLNPDVTPKEILQAPNSKNTLRGVLGQILNMLNHKTGGAFIGAAADLYGSTSLSTLNKGFPEGFYNSVSNPKSRMISAGGICEDAMGAVMTGISTFGQHIGVAASYAAFIAAFEHVATRVHCIGQQLKQELEKSPYNTFIMINGHAGVKTGEDGPTHADPQPLQLLQENFVKGTGITLTPWDPNEIWPLMAQALKHRPALIAPFVTRPTETIVDRQALGLAPASMAKYGVYPLLKADPNKKAYHGTVVIQGSESGYAFVTETLPKIRQAGLNLNVYYVASAELFDLLPKAQQEQLFPAEHAAEAMGITGFTMPTMYRWLNSREGREFSLYPFKAGHYLGSGKSEMVVKQAGLDGDSQFEGISKYAAWVSTKKSKESHHENMAFL